MQLCDRRQAAILSNHTVWAQPASHSWVLGESVHADFKDQAHLDPASYSAFLLFDPPQQILSTVSDGPSQPDARQVATVRQIPQSSLRDRQCDRGFASSQ